MNATREGATIWQRLADGIPERAIQWRADGKPTVRDGRSVVRQVAYIEANTVRERLDGVVPGEWDLTLDLLPPLEDEGERVVAFKCRLQVLGVIREDVGTGRDYKSAATDALKRAAVRFGIAHELYDMECKWVPANGTTAAAPRTPSRAPAPRPPATEDPSVDGDVRCPKCGGATFDNRMTKRNPRAPDFRCRDRSCDGVVWPERAPASVVTGEDDLQPLDDDGIPF